MSRGTTDRSNYESIAKSIRGKLGTTTEYLPSEMARAIGQIVTPEKEVCVSYVVGETEYAIDWISDVEDGEPLTPMPSVLYVIATDDNYGEIYRWDGESYVAVGGSGGISADSVEYPLEMDEGVLKLRLLNSLYVYNNSLALGYATTATGSYAHAEGMATEASGSQSHAEGAGSKAQGSASHAEGNGSIASGSGSHAEGGSSTASGVNAHAEGGNSRATSANAHAEGAGTLASGYQSHAEGGGTTASGVNSHAEGGGSEAHGENSHAGGYNTKAFNSSGSRPQTVLGAYNVPDATEDPQSGDMVPSDTYALIVGNGTSQTPSNALALDWNGNLYLSGQVDSDSLPSYVDDVIEGYMYQGSFYEDSAHTVEVVGETGKIYVDLSTDTSYRWSGSAYVYISNPIDFATQADAEAGTDNTKAMTPLRTKQAIDANAYTLPEMSADVRGGAKLQEKGGLALRDGALGVGSLLQESDGYANGGIAELTAKGYAEQVSTTGKNLIDLLDSWRLIFNGLTRSVTDNLVEIIGTATSDESLFLNFSKTVIVKAGSYYTFSFDDTVYLSDYLTFTFQNASSNTLMEGNLEVGSNSITMLASETGACTRIQLGIRNGLALNVNTYAQLELGTTATPYEPYVDGTPSPDYPQEIQVVRGRNLLDEIEQGGFNTSGMNTSNATRIRSTHYMHVSAGNDYVVSGNGASGKTLQVSASWYTTADYSTPRTSSTSFMSVPCVITAPTGANYVRFLLRNSDDSNISPSDVSHIQLTLGSTPQPYVPYGHVGMEVRDANEQLLSTIHISLPQRGWVAGLPDGTADELRLDSTGAVDWTLPTSEVVFDGSESWSYDSRYKYFASSIDASTPKTGGYAGLASHFINASEITSLSESGGFSDMTFVVSTSLISNSSTIAFKYNDITTVSDWNTWLSTHNVNVLYPLATPIVEQVGYVDMSAIPSDCTITIPELDELNVRYFVDRSITDYGNKIMESVQEKLDVDDYRKALKWGEVSDEWLWGETGQTPSTQGTTYTDNLNLIKPGLETTISVDDFNDNADAIDNAYGNVTASLADIESTTATSNHAVGDYFMLGGVLMRTTSAIATGEQITTSNAVPATFQSQIDALRDSVTHNQVDSSALSVHFKRIGGQKLRIEMWNPDHTQMLGSIYFKDTGITMDTVVDGEIVRNWDIAP